MDQAPLETPDAKPAPSPGWPAPWRGLIIGGGLVALMATPLGAMPGFIMIWVVIIAAAPFMIAASLIGGPAAPYVAGGLALAAYVAAPAAFCLIAIVRAPDRRTRARRLDRFAIFLLLPVAFALAVRSLGEAWP